MKIPSVLLTCAAVSLPSFLPAQTAAADQAAIDSLTRELAEQQQQLTALQKQLATLADGTDAASQPGSRFQPAAPLTLARAGGSYVNISLIGDIAAGASSKPDVGTLQMGGHDPAQRGFTIQGVEAVFEGAVDNYFRAFATVLYSLNTEGNSYLELEEAYAETLGLPGGLQLRVGQYFTEFGRINTQHPHAWAFVDAPIVTARFLGPDGLRNPGARISWLAPTPFYSEVFFGVQNSQGETAHSFRNEYGADDGHGHAHAEDTLWGRPSTETSVRGLDDMLYTARYTAAFDLSESQTLLGGVSGAWGPNSTGENARTQIYGADVFWKWKPADHHKGFPFVSLQGEVLFRGFEAAAATVETVDHSAPGHVHIDVDLPSETLWDWGFYAQLSYGFHEGWVASLRGDYVNPITHGEYEKILGENDAARGERWRVSPALTWYPSEFSRIRLQYNYDHGDTFGSAHGVWLQMEFLLGSHGAHTF